MRTQCAIEYEKRAKQLTLSTLNRKPHKNSHWFNTPIEPATNRIHKPDRPPAIDALEKKGFINW